jgi:hypothetical protein
MELAPEETVGFEMAVGYRLNSGEAIQLPEAYVGGCGGVVQKGRTEEYSTKVQSANVLVDGVSTEVQFSFVARWFLGDAGCEEGEILSPVEQL